MIKSILIAIAMGVLTFVLCLFGVWFSVTLLLMHFGPSAIPWAIGLTLIPSLLAGGFVASRLAGSASAITLVAVGVVVGMVSMVVVGILTRAHGSGETGFAIGFWALQLIGGTAVTLAGTFLSVFVQRRGSAKFRA